MFVCALLLWLCRRALRCRRRFARRIAYRRRMALLTLKQDAERTFFLAMMTTATEATLTRKTIWTKCRNQGYFENCVGNWDADGFKRNFRISKATF